MSQGAVEVVGLQKSYGEQVALRGVDLSAAAGSVLGVLGPNGAGKTTLIRILATLTRASAGTARICGYDVATQPDRVRQLIGLTGQYASVDEELTGRENLRLLGELLDLPRREARHRAEELLEWVGLVESADRRVRGYSGGMRRRLDLAASLVARPSVIFLDEPSTGLDPAARAGLWDAVASLGAAGTTVLLTSQYLEEVDVLADEVVVIDHGSVVAQGSPTSLKERVGPRRLRVLHAHLADAQAAQRRLAGRWEVAVAAEQRAVVIAVDGTQDAAAALAELGAAGIEVLEAQLALPSLDEVFLELTSAGSGVVR